MTNVDTVQDAGRPAGGGSAEEHDPVPAAADWLLGILTGVIGLVLTAIGVGMYTRVDRALIADLVAEEGVQVNGLTEAEFITAAGEFVDWFAIGVVLTGIVLVVGAAAFLVARRRTRRRVTREGGTTATFWACAIYGAVVTALASFIPGSAIFGGGAAAYLHDSDTSLRTGAAAGLVGSLLVLPLLAFLAVGLVAGAGAIGEAAAGTVLVALVVGAQMLAVAINVGFGALGGFLVDRLD